MPIGKKRYDEDIPEGSPSQDHTDRHSRDAFLRSKGFKIHARPRHGHSVWERGGELYDYPVALAEAEGLIKSHAG